MTRPSPIPSDERIVGAMIHLARAITPHGMIVAGPHSTEVLLELQRRGYPRVTTAKLCVVPCGHFEVTHVAWQEQPTEALERTLDGLVRFLSTAGVLVIWLDARDCIPIQILRLALDRFGFRIEAGTTCENGAGISARRLEPKSIAKVA